MDGTVVRGTVILDGVALGTVIEDGVIVAATDTDSFAADSILNFMAGFMVAKDSTADFTEVKGSTVEAASMVEAASTAVAVFMVEDAGNDTRPV